MPMAEFLFVSITAPDQPPPPPLPFRGLLQHHGPQYRTAGHLLHEHHPGARQHQKWYRYIVSLSAILIVIGNHMEAFRIRRYLT